MIKALQIKEIVSSLFLLIGITMVCYLPSQNDFYLVFLSYTLAFIGYVGAIKYIDKKAVLVLVILSGGLAIGSFPNLSDDIYRFYWDGIMTKMGISPYAFTPYEILNSSMQTEELKALFPKLNSPNYYSIYPPVCQLIYLIGSLTGSIVMASVAMKILFFGLHMFAFKVVYKWDKLKVLNGRNLAAVYFLNPLVVIEGIGNLHIEIVMVSFLILMYNAISNQKRIQAAFWYALAIGVKMLPLIIIPYFIFRMQKQDRNKFLIYLGLFLAFIFLPIFIGLDIYNLSKSINLYFQKFEFNASVYYVLRWFGKLISGYNLIFYLGPLLGLTTFYFLVKKAKKDLNFSFKSQLTYGLFAYGVFLLLATTVHPWYVITLVFYGACLGYASPIVWSYLITLTYINYSFVPYKEQIWMVAIEYILLGLVLIYEFRNAIKSKMATKLT